MRAGTAEDSSLKRTQCQELSRSKSKLISRRGKGAFVSAAPLPQRVGRHGADDGFRQGQFVQIVPLCINDPPRVPESLSNNCCTRKRTVEFACEALPASPLVGFVACTCMAWSDGRMLVYGHNSLSNIQEPDSTDGSRGHPGSVILGKWRDEPTVSAAPSLSAMNERGVGSYVGRVTAMRCFVDLACGDQPMKRQRNSSREHAIVPEMPRRNGFVGANENHQARIHARLVIILGYESGAMRLFAVDLDRYSKRNRTASEEDALEAETPLAQSLQLWDVCTLRGRIDSIAVSTHDSEHGNSNSTHCIQHVFVACHNQGSEIQAIRLLRSQSIGVESSMKIAYRWEDGRQDRRVHLSNLNGNVKLQIATSPDGKYMAFAAAECLSAFQLAPWCTEGDAGVGADIIEPERVWRFTGHPSPICCLEFLHCRLLASASLGDSLISLWKLDPELGVDPRTQLYDLVETAPWGTALCQANGIVPASVVQMVSVGSFEGEETIDSLVNGWCAANENGHPNESGDQYSSTGKVVVDLSANPFHSMNTTDTAFVSGQGKDTDDSVLVALLGDGVVQVFGIHQNGRLPHTVKKRPIVRQPLVVLLPPVPCAASGAPARFVDAFGSCSSGLMVFYGSPRQPLVKFLPNSIWSRDASVATNGKTALATRVINIGSTSAWKVTESSESPTKGGSRDADLLVHPENAGVLPRLNGNVSEQDAEVLGYAHLPVASTLSSAQLEMSRKAQEAPESSQRPATDRPAFPDGSMTEPTTNRDDQIHLPSGAIESGLALKDLPDVRSNRSLPSSSTTIGTRPASIEAHQGPELLTLGERITQLQAYDGTLPAIDTPEDDRIERPLPVQSVATLLVQALDANDAQLLDKALAAVHTSGGVSRTVRRLPARAVIPLFCALVERFCSRSVRAPTLSIWLRALILCNASFLLSQRDAPVMYPSASLRNVRDAMQALYHAIEEQRCLREALVRLEGRLELILAFAQPKPSAGSRLSNQLDVVPRNQQARSPARSGVLTPALPNDDETSTSSTTSASSSATGGESEATQSTDESTASQ